MDTQWVHTYIVGAISGPHTVRSLVMAKLRGHLADSNREWVTGPTYGNIAQRSYAQMSGKPLSRSEELNLFGGQVLWQEPHGVLRDGVYHFGQYGIVERPFHTDCSFLIAHTWEMPDTTGADQ